MEPIPFGQKFVDENEMSPATKRVLNFDPDKAPLRIVRAAIRDNLGGVWSVPIPGRHHDVIREMREAGYKGPVSGRDQQGFLLNDGRFIRRKAAYRIAKRAGQLLQEEPIGADVTSEDLW